MNEPNIIAADCNPYSNLGSCASAGQTIKTCVGLQVQPESGFVEIGSTWQFSAIILYSDGTTEDVSSLATWASSSTGVVTIDENGLATGVAGGLATITASYCSQQGFANMEVATACVDTAIDTVVVLARSAKMGAEENGQTKTSIIAKGVKSLIDGMAEDDKTALISFAGLIYSSPASKQGESTVDHPLSSDKDALNAALASYSVRGPCLFPDATTGPNRRCETGIGTALQQAYDELIGAGHVNGNQRMVILVVDGKDTILEPDPEEVAAAIIAEGMYLMIVGIDIPNNYISTLMGMATPGLFYAIRSASAAASLVASATFNICYGYAPQVIIPCPECVLECEGDDCDVAEPLFGLRWEMPCRASNGLFCSCIDPSDQVLTLAGNPTKIYDVTMRFRGVVEMKALNGGTNNGAYFQTGGSPATDGFNVYSLIVTNPSQTYYLNRANGVNTSGTHKIDYVVTVPMRGGTTVTMRARNIDGTQIANYNHLTFADVAPLSPLFYDGQFIQMDVLAVEEQ